MLNKVFDADAIYTDKSKEMSIIRENLEEIWSLSNLDNIPYDLENVSAILNNTQLLFSDVIGKLENIKTEEIKEINRYQGLLYTLNEVLKTCIIDIDLITTNLGNRINELNKTNKHKER